MCLSFAAGQPRFQNPTAAAAVERNVDDAVDNYLGGPPPRLVPTSKITTYD